MGWGEREWLRMGGLYVKMAYRREFHLKWESRTLEQESELKSSVPSQISPYISEKLWHRSLTQETRQPSLPRECYLHLQCYHWHFHACLSEGTPLPRWKRRKMRHMSGIKKKKKKKKKNGSSCITDADFLNWRHVVNIVYNRLSLLLPPKQLPEA